jgi:uncharacterized hydantoinase/oxoprolinase family protein
MKVAGADGERIASAIEAMGYVCVPKVATAEMLEEGDWDATAEDAGAVWSTMIAVSEGTFTVDQIPVLSAEAHRVIEAQGIGS